jgi:hypothetical protein
MFRKNSIARLTGVLSLTTGLLAGCESATRRSAYADNPLLLNRQPVQVSPTTPAADRPVAVASAAPTTVVPPPVPVPAAAPTSSSMSPVALTQSAAEPTPADGPTLPVPVASALPQPLAGEEASIREPNRPADLPVPAPAATADARRTDAKYGAANDYTWLQGELDRHYKGYVELRYRAHSEVDTFGGKVRLENDPRLADYRPGDVVCVEGEMVKEPDAASGTTAQYPRYHVRSIRLIERK